MEGLPIGIFTPFLSLVIIGVIIYFFMNHTKVKLITFQKIALTLSIIIVLNLLFNYAIFTVYPEPEFDEFCTEETRQYYTSQDSCEAIGGEWISVIGEGSMPVERVEKPVPIEVGQPQPYCDATKTCRESYEGAHSVYNRNVFIVLVVLGTASLALGFFLVDVSAISLGFLFGGLLSLFIGTVRYWSDMNEYLRLVVLVAVLAALIFLGYRKLRDKEE